MRWHVHVAHVRIVGRLAVHAGDDAGRHAVGRRERHGAVAGRGSVQRRRVLRVVAAIGAASPARHGGT